MNSTSIFETQTQAQGNGMMDLRSWFGTFFVVNIAVEAVASAVFGWNLAIEFLFVWICYCSNKILDLGTCIVPVKARSKKIASSWL